MSLGSSFPGEEKNNQDDDSYSRTYDLTFFVLSIKHSDITEFLS